MKYIIHDYKVLKTIDLKKFNAEIYFTYEWVNYLEKAMKVHPFIIEIKDDKTIGYFVGAYFKKFGVKIVGSPFRGWDTPYMGLLLDNKYSRTKILSEIWNVCKKELKCIYMEVADINISLNDVKKIKNKYIIEQTYWMNINKNDEELLSSFTKHCRKDLRLFINRNASIASVKYSTNFLNDFYIMLEKVFSVQNLNPPYSKEKLNILFSTIPSDNILCLETYNPDGKCIGRSVSFGYSDKCYAFASATDRNENYNQKNYLRWEAIRKWRDNKKTTYDLMGVRNYKLEFNPEIKEYYRIIYTKYSILLYMRNFAQHVYWFFNKIKHIIKKILSKKKVDMA